VAGLLAAGILVLVPSPSESVKDHCVHISTTSTFQFRVFEGRYQRRTVVRIVHHCAGYTSETLRRYPWAWSTGPIR
jgi:hypothetical protein